MVGCLVWFCLLDWSEYGEYWLVNLLIDWLIDWLIDRLIRWLIDWLIDLLVDQLIDWLIWRLIDWLIYWFIDRSRVQTGVMEWYSGIIQFNSNHSRFYFFVGFHRSVISITITGSLHSLIDRMIDWSIDWLRDWLIGCMDHGLLFLFTKKKMKKSLLMDWLVACLTDCITGWHINWLDRLEFWLIDYGYRFWS